MTFTIGPFRDTVVCDVSPLYCVDLLLGLPFQQAWNIVYHVKFHYYHLQHERCIYVLTSSTPHSTQPLTGQAVNKKVTLKKYISLCLVRPIKPDHLTDPEPQDMAPLLLEVINVFPQPMGLPPSFSIEHTIDLILEASFPNAPSYCLAPQEANVIECQPDQLLNSSPSPPSSSPYVSQTFRMPKWVFVPGVSASRLCTCQHIITLCLEVHLFPKRLLRKLQENRILTSAI
jgi:hypothetical protein